MRGTRSVVYICAVAGTFVGGYLPVLWGSSDFSGTSLLFSVFGGVAGIFVGVRLSQI